MEWIKYVLFVIFVLITCACWILAWRFWSNRLSEREINLYDKWLMRFWLRYRIGLTIMLGVVFGLLSIAVFTVKY